jgi:hypothetical protein
MTEAKDRPWICGGNGAHLIAVQKCYMTGSIKDYDDPCNVFLNGVALFQMSTGKDLKMGGKEGRGKQYKKKIR